MAEERGAWSGRAAFLLAAIGSAIGLGNVWRFPYLTYKCGGGAFLIAYMICVFAVGIPWMLVEMGIGHYMQSGAPRALGGIGRRYEWIGWFATMASFILVMYYAVIMSWALCYTFFSAYLPWGVGEESVTGVNDFFYNTFLGQTDGPEIAGGISIPIAIALIIGWIVIYLKVSGGVERIGKVSIYFVIACWIALIVFTVRGLTLPGAMDGIERYLNPDFSELANPELRFGALSQVAFSLSLGMGTMIAYASYLPNDAEINKSAIITSLADTGTAFLAGFSVFSSAGFLAYSLGIPFEEITVSSIPLTFITIPIAVSMMPAIPHFFGVLFFLSLWLLALTSAYSLTQTFVTGVQDKYGISRKKATAIACAISLAIGLLVFARGFGLYWIEMVDRGISYYSMLISGFMTCIVVGWIFGAEKLRKHLNSVSEIKIGGWFDWCAKIVAPAGMLYVILWGVASDVRGYGGYPSWANALGIGGSIIAAAVVAIFFTMSRERRA
jgi:NSS family neurotransmitter:Na+ symporter